MKRAAKIKRAQRRERLREIKRMAPIYGVDVEVIRKDHRNRRWAESHMGGLPSGNGHAFVKFQTAQGRVTLMEKVSVFPSTDIMAKLHLAIHAGALRDRETIRREQIAAFQKQMAIIWSDRLVGDFYASSVMGALTDKMSDEILTKQDKLITAAMMYGAPYRINTGKK